MIPLTGYEQSGKIRTTTLSEETVYLGELADFPRISVEQLATSTEGHPMWLVGVGRSGKPVLGEKPSLFINGCPHGDEPAGRESTLIFLRELALTEDPALLAYLDRFDVWALPTSNPDGRNRDGRNVVFGPTSVDLNRDTLELLTPESRAIAHIIRWGQPQVVVDLHENWQAPDMMMTAGVTCSEIDPAQRAMNDALNQHVIDAMRSRGHTASDYGGGKVPTMLRNSAAFRYAMTIVAEGYSGGPLEGRVDILSELLYDTVSWHYTHRLTLSKTLADAKKRRAKEGAKPTKMFSLDNEVDYNEISPPTEYILTWEQYGSFMRVAALLGIQVEAPTQEGGTAVVRMGQGAQGMIPQILDQASEWRVISDEVPPLLDKLPEVWKYRLNGVRADVVRAGYVINGKIAPIYTQKPAPERYT